MKMRIKQTSLMIIIGASLLSACTPNLQILPDRVQASPPPPPAKPVAPRPATPVQKPKKPAAVSRTLPLPKEEPPKVEVLQYRQDKAVSDEAQEPEVLDVQQEAVRKKKYDSSPAARALIKQADTEIGMGKLATATATIERALRIEPENPDLWMKLSELHKRQGNNEQAASMADKAVYYQEQLN